MAAQADVTYRLSDGRLVDVGGFDRAVAHANAAYARWVDARDEAELDAFATALAEMIETAPKGRRLAPEKIRRRYAKAEGEPAFEAVLGGLESHDIFEDAE